MKKIIPILLAIVLFTSLSYAFTSPPGLIDKLDKMFEWTKRNMEVQNAVRPPVFISSPPIFNSICASYKKMAHDCDKILGMYGLDGVIHISNTDEVSIYRKEAVIIHEMAHAIQHIKYGYKFMADNKNNKLLQKEADLTANIYIIEKYGVHMRR